MITLSMPAAVQYAHDWWSDVTFSGVGAPSAPDERTIP